MVNTLGIIQVRSGSAPASSHLSRMLGGKSVLEWIIRRVTDCQRLDAVVVALADNTDEHGWAGLVPPDVSVMYSGRPDPLARCAEVLEQCPARAVVRVCGHNLFVDPVLIDRLVSTADNHVGCDYIGFGSREGRAAANLPVGMFPEWCRGDALRRADIEALAATDRDEVTRYVYSRPEEFGVRLLTLPPELEAEEVRRKLDCAENWEMTQTIFDTLGPEEWDWRRLASMVMHQPPARRPKHTAHRSAVA